MVTNYPINPRVRALGKARLDFAGRTQNPIDWETRWVRPSNPFPFVGGDSWKQCVEYRVEDFPAEVGFFIDVLGFSVNALDPDYAMFTSPQGDFFISILPISHSEQSTPPNAIRLQIMVKDIFLTTQQLQERGISLAYIPQPLQPGSSVLISSFRTPHGISIKLWGRLEPLSATQLELNKTKFAVNPENGDDDESELDDESDEAEDTGKDNGSGGNDAGDEDEFDEADEEEEPVEEGNGSDEEKDLEDGDDLVEEDDDSEHDEEEFEDDDDNDFDDDEYESDWDEDEDDDDEDEDLKTLNSTSQMDPAPFSPTPPPHAKPAAPSHVTPLTRPGRLRNTSTLTSLEIELNGFEFKGVLTHNRDCSMER